ncbi:type VI secretion IcmF C-terminal domain-containing protein [Hahella ganghwensis]|uniref:type VI secretion IcmF C-terminal domain-containing protein n=1 Tax=Hahella ganghwensis TaxID=286420 RepID=UPI0012FA4F21|nr:type VI secretion IcmF C-terminal domain-containing protein [Hahella ganghwensis]
MATFQVEKEWQEGVYPECASLEERYPFNPEASEDVSLKEFEDYFGPESVWHKFYLENLQSYWDDQTGPQEKTRVFSEAFVEQVNAGRFIHLAFFLEQQGADFPISIKPSTMAPSIRRLLLNVGGTEGSASLGPRFWRELPWPAPQPGASLVVETLDGSSEKYEFPGDWALFRLLDSADIDLDSANTSRVQFHFGEIDATYEIKASNAYQLRALKMLSEYRCSW